MIGALGSGEICFIHLHIEKYCSLIPTCLFYYYFFIYFYFHLRHFRTVVKSLDIWHFKPRYAIDRVRYKIVHFRFVGWCGKSTCFAIGGALFIAYHRSHWFINPKLIKNFNINHLQMAEQILQWLYSNHTHMTCRELKLMFEFSLC